MTLQPNPNTIKSEIRLALINNKVNVCPMVRQYCNIDLLAVHYVAKVYLL